MENLNAEQIKKDMEHCINDDCDKCSVPFGNCQANLIENALALITAQEQRIKELTEKNDATWGALTDANNDRKKLTEENERLKARVLEENHLRHQVEEMLANGMSAVKADTVRKMQELIKERCLKGGIYPAFVARTIDQIAKELEG